jgi:hypothetical protein
MRGEQSKVMSRSPSIALASPALTIHRDFKSEQMLPKTVFRVAAHVINVVLNPVRLSEITISSQNWSRRLMLRFHVHAIFSFPLPPNSV